MAVNFQPLLDELKLLIDQTEFSDKGPNRCGHLGYYW